MIMGYFMKAPCKHCPFRKDVKPFLHPERAEEIAYHASNEYNSFPCHKTTVADDNDEEGGMVCNDDTKECAGFLTLQIREGANIPDDFTPAYNLVYESISDMVYAYEQEWNK
jgi:hypothetical protein